GVQTCALPIFVVDREVTLAPDVEGLALLGRPKPFAGELDRKAVHPLTSLCPRSGLIPPGASLHTRPTGSRTRSRRATPCSTGPRAPRRTAPARRRAGP